MTADFVGGETDDGVHLEGALYFSDYLNRPAVQGFFDVRSLR
jgi:hypothetical protein